MMKMKFIINTATFVCVRTDILKEVKPVNMERLLITKTLSELKKGEGGRVMRITAKNPVRRRILEMGVTPGTDICVQGIAPLGDPMEILVKGYHLSLRKGEAACILVEVQPL